MSMKIKYELTNLRAIRRVIQEFYPYYEGLMEEFIAKGARILRSEVKRSIKNVVYQGKVPRKRKRKRRWIKEARRWERTGALYRSVDKRQISRWAWLVVVAVPYAWKIEQRTPYARPAFEKIVGYVSKWDLPRLLELFKRKLEERILGGKGRL